MELCAFPPFVDSFVVGALKEQETQQIDTFSTDSSLYIGMIGKVLPASTIVVVQVWVQL